MISFKAPAPDLRGPIATLRMQTQRNAAEVLELVGIAVVGYLRSLTSEMRPPSESGGGPRPAHPGHWADVTGELARSYWFKIVETANGVSLAIGNDSAHAAYVEMRDGFFVVTGIMEPNGPVMEAIRVIGPAVAPGWRVA